MAENEMSEEDMVNVALAELKRFGEPDSEDLSGTEGLAKDAANSAVPDELCAEETKAVSDASIRELSREENDNVNIRSLIKDLNLPQKVKLALFGNKTCRGLLINDSNKLIQLCVLKNAKMVEQEVVDFSKNSSMAQLVLRAISERKEWMKNYDIKFNIVTNPKTPSDIALRWLRFLQFHDIKDISRSKNLPQVVAVSAKKKVTEVEEQKKKG